MSELVTADDVFVGLDLDSREAMLRFIARKAVERGIATDEDAVFEALQEREEMGETGLTDGFAVPHARSSAIVRPAVLVFKNGRALDWPSFDGKPVSIAIALLVPEGDAGNEHIKLLSKTAVLLMHNDFKALLRSSADAAAVADAIRTGLAA